ncbi:MAG: flagellar hook capping FlgD N-terminal domain-containing protein [Afipia sp.]|uniref:Basal-body rod modification protein FlgD n=1 Tax=Afipia massiliensis TaxID=211460 RepID=A0A840MWS2_9BRAD|nr:flagellar hook capping FlgD N-terminal domain-containing protein [Afipia massiliensis]MBB5052769.1 flagellar basal-body rod modification protein FlgD [Afipia massiliensis]MDZ4369612.1 flagellar hook capping FlgD N-terminal domain-containing protein [Afipia sp.]
MAVDATTAPIPTSGITTNNSSGSSSTSGSSTGIADNFQSFLMLLTTQLQNQNPMDPLDTNQFTQQLVQFAQVEQQLKSNSQLEALVKIEKTAQSTQALVFVGQTVAVDGSTAHFDGNATWNFSAPSNSSATITITNSAGQTAYTGSFAIGSGNSSFVWDGKGADGTKWPAGDYKMTVTAKDSNGKDVAISTEVQGTVDSVDLTASPALLSIGGKNYTLEQIKRVVRPPASS